jgi:hypothetical protein
MKYSDFQKASHIRKVLMTLVGENLSYNWNDKQQKENLHSINEFMVKWETQDGESYKVNPSKLTKSEMEHLNFPLWTEGNGKSVYCIPIWLYNFLVDEWDGVASENDVDLVKVYKKDVDNDHRMGALFSFVIPVEDEVQTKYSDFDKGILLH